MPYVVFIAAPEFDTLKAMHQAVVDAGITTKQLTVSLDQSDDICTNIYLYGLSVSTSSLVIECFFFTGCRPEEDHRRECPYSPGV